MTLPSSGPISASQINTELGFSANARITLNDAAVRGLSGQTSGAVSFSALRGKSSVPVFNPAPAAGYNQIGLNSATFKITSSLPVVWTWNRQGNTGGANVISGNTSSSITFSVNGRLVDVIFNVTATYNGVQYNWTIELMTENTLGGGTQ